MRTPIDYKNCILLREYNRHFAEGQSDDLEIVRDAKIMIFVYFVVLVSSLGLLVPHVLERNGQASVMDLVVAFVMLLGLMSSFSDIAEARKLAKDGLVIKGRIDSMKSCSWGEFDGSEITYSFETPCGRALTGTTEVSGEPEKWPTEHCIIVLYLNDQKYTVL